MTYSDTLITLKAQNLAKTLGILPLFTGLNFTIKNGELLILRGENGSGKTTLLNILAGLISCDEGVLQLNLNEAQTFETNEISQYTHYLGHKNGLKHQHTIRQNISFWSVFLSNTSPRSPSKASSEHIAANKLNIAHLLDLPVEALSAGQKRRAAFARLLVSKRPIWMLDEPTSALDEASGDIIEKLVLDHLSQGGVCITATHLPFLKSHPQQSIKMNNFAPASFQLPLDDAL